MYDCTAILDKNRVREENYAMNQQNHLKYLKSAIVSQQKVKPHVCPRKEHTNTFPLHTLRSSLAL